MRYRVEGSIGSGAYGVVYRCFDEGIRRQVAVKQFLPRFQQVIGEMEELRVPGRLEHRNVITIFDVLPSSGAIVMELAEGSSLRDRMVTDLGWVQANFPRLMLEICEGLRAAHSEKIIHRDIKPENILLSKDGSVRIADFGVCKFLDSADATNGMAGTPPYMALEVLSEQEYGPEADIHSLGCLMYEVWAGHLPWLAYGSVGSYIAVKSQGDPVSLREASPTTVPDVLSDLVRRMVTHGEGRIRNIDVVVQRLAYLLPGHNGAKRTIDDLQLTLGATYGFVNAYRSPLYLLAQYLISIKGLTQELLRSRSNNPDAQRLFVKSFAWLCAASTAINVRPGQLIWLKYDDVCPYCGQALCSCPALWPGGPSERNAALLERLKHRQVNQAPPPESFESYRAMFRRMFGSSNEREGVEKTALHAYSEVAEAMDALLHLLPNNDAESILALHLEFSDLVAWFYALLNSYDHDFNFEEEFDATFAAGCYACGSSQCSCPEPLGVSNWRAALEVIPDYER